MAKLVSVIVPVYNTRPYLRACAESVLRQTRSDLELILIDDGSQDGSAEICAALRDEDPRVRFLPRPHGGASAARNAGLDEAQGEYVFFLDSDDVIHPRLLEALTELCETTGASFATEVYLRVNDQDPFVFPERGNAQAGGGWRHTRFTSAEALSQLFSSENINVFSGIGGKLIRRRDVGPLRFDLSMENCEDTLFVYRFLDAAAEKGLGTVILRESWYAYRSRPESSTQRRAVKYYEDTLQCWKHILEREWNRGRSERASACAELLADRLRELYVNSRLEHNEVVLSFLRSRSKEILHSSWFRMLSLVGRFSIWLLFTSFPLFIVLRQVYRWLCRIRERYSPPSDI